MRLFEAPIKLPQRVTVQVFVKRSLATSEARRITLAVQRTNAPRHSAQLVGVAGKRPLQGRRGLPRCIQCFEKGCEILLRQCDRLLLLNQRLSRPSWLAAL